jgi:hypothetical protein
MGAGGAASTGGAGGVQAGTVNAAAQGTAGGDADDPSLGSGMAVPGQGNRMGDAATGGAAGVESDVPGTVTASAEPFELPYRVTTPPSPER